MTVRSSTLRQNPAYRPGTSPLIAAVAAVAAAAIGLACGGSVPRQAVTPQPSPAAVAPPASWKPVPDLLPHDYTIAQHAFVTVTSAAGLSSDSTSLQVTASLRRTADGGAAGVVTAVQVGSPGVRPRVPDSLSVPFAVTAAFRARRLAPAFTAVVGGGASSCPAVALPALNALRDAVFWLPESLYVGASWADSGSVPVCAGATSLTLATVRTYVVTQHVGASLADSVPEDHFVVRRTTRMTVSGQANRGDDTTTVTGRGSGTATFLLASATGGVIGGSGAAALDLLLRSATQEERARQTVAIRVRRRGS